jgi:hypothetical protein
MFRDRAHFNSFIMPWDKDGNSVRKGEHLKVLGAAKFYSRPEQFASLQADLPGLAHRSPATPVRVL